MNRRQFIEFTSLILAGGSLPLKAHSAEYQQQLFALGKNFIQQPVNIFTPAQRQLVRRLVEIIIPRTDTPGALDAKADHFIELTVAHYMNPQEREVFVSGLDGLQVGVLGAKSLDKSLKEKSLEEKSLEEQIVERLIQQLTELEERHSDAPWYQLGNRVGNGFDSSAPFICQLKELTVVGFFMSEVGATQVLRHNPMPGNFDGETPLATDQPSWARNRPGDYS
ncbi:MAG: gluconate 2-dehydrogenase subunit 3 family protein [Porticoccaceae bacterium]|nr:gluconate 2-dehydrogenase subunit 3 family protein [Porticoccaceae bacterium]